MIQNPTDDNNIANLQLQEFRTMLYGKEQSRSKINLKESASNSTMMCIFRHSKNDPKWKTEGEMRDCRIEKQINRYLVVLEQAAERTASLCLVDFSSISHVIMDNLIDFEFLSIILSLLFLCRLLLQVNDIVGNGFGCFFLSRFWCVVFGDFWLSRTTSHVFVSFPLVSRTCVELKGHLLVIGEETEEMLCSAFVL